MPAEVPHYSQRQERPVILLTGFGPFPGVPANATTILVPRIAEAARRAFAGSVIVSHIVPTEWGAGLDVVDGLYRDLRPEIALHFGVSSRATGFEIVSKDRNVRRTYGSAREALADPAARLFVLPVGRPLIEPLTFALRSSSGPRGLELPV